MLFQARAGRNTGNSDFLWCSWGHGINWFVFGNWYRFSIWLQLKGQLACLPLLTCEHSAIKLAAFCCTVACARVVECARAYAKVCLLCRVTRHVASTYGRSMTNGANYKRGKLHHSPWHSDIRTPNQLNTSKVLVDSRIQGQLLLCSTFGALLVFGVVFWIGSTLAGCLLNGTTLLILCFSWSLALVEPSGTSLSRCARLSSSLVTWSSLFLLSSTIAYPVWVRLTADQYFLSSSSQDVCLSCTISVPYSSAAQRPGYPTACSSSSRRNSSIRSLLPSSFPSLHVHQPE